MFRHDHIAGDQKLVFPSGFFQNFQEEVAPRFGVQKRKSTITGASNKVPVSPAIDAYQSFWHRLIVQSHPLRLNESRGESVRAISRKGWGTHFVSRGIDGEVQRLGHPPLADRSIESGHLEVGNASEILKDGAIGSCWSVLEHLGAKAVQAIAGKTSEQIAERASGSSLGNRHQTSLKNQAKAAKKAEENGEKVGK